MDALIGKLLGQYQIISEIGRGGMAIVYKAHHRQLEREVALKVLPPQFAFDNEFVKRFLLEARAAAKLKHPDIVTIYDVGEQDGFYYIVMEWIDGGTLADLIRKAGALAPTRAANILTQIASALDYAHALGFVHRDVKPSNILVGASDGVHPHDHATLTDFGIVKAAEGTRVTKSGTMIGTPEYMSPEQIRGQNIDGRADIYALGVVAYEMLAGRVPFAGDTARILHAQVYEAPPSLRTINARVSSAVEQVVNKALAKEPAQRYTRAGEFANALNAAVSGSIPTRQAAATPNVSSPRQKPNQAWVWIGGAVGVSLLLIAFVLLIFGGRSGVNGNANGILTNTPTSVAVVVATLAPSETDLFTPSSVLARTLTNTPTNEPTFVSIATPTSSLSMPVLTDTAVLPTDTPLATATQSPVSTATKEPRPTVTIQVALPAPRMRLVNDGQAVRAINLDTGQSTQVFNLGLRTLCDSGAITASCGSISSATWSSDGRQVLVSFWWSYSHTSNYGSTVRLMFQNASNVVDILTAGPSEGESLVVTDAFGDAIWSPDGSRVAVRRALGANYGVFSSNSNGSGLQRIASSDISDYPRYWSVDGKWVIASSSNGGFYALEVDGTRRIPLSELGVKFYDETYYPWRILDQPEQ